MKFFCIFAFVLLAIIAGAWAGEWKFYFNEQNRNFNRTMQLLQINISANCHILKGIFNAEQEKLVIITMRLSASVKVWFTEAAMQLKTISKLWKNVKKLARTINQAHDSWSMQPKVRIRMMTMNEVMRRSNTKTLTDALKCSIFSTKRRTQFLNLFQWQM